MCQVDGVLHDVDLLLERRGDVDRGVGDDQRIEVVRHIHDEAVADAPLGADTAVAGNDRPHQLIGMQTALHQGPGLRLAHQRHRLGRRIVAVRRLDDRQAGDVDAVPLRHLEDACTRPDQHRLDQPQFPCLDRTAQRYLVARMRNGGDDRGQLPRRVDQTQILVVRPRPYVRRMCSHDVHAAQMSCGRQTRIDVDQSPRAYAGAGAACSTDSRAGRPNQSSTAATAPMAPQPRNASL